MNLSFRIARRTRGLWRRNITSVTDNTLKYIEKENAVKKGVRSASLKLPKHSYVNFPLACNHFEFQTLIELQEKACIQFADKPVLGTKNGPIFEWMTYRQLGEEIQKFRNVLGSKKFQFNDKVAIISNNRAEWPVVMYATMTMGGQIVPMYEAQLERDWRHIVEDSDSKVLVVANDTIYQKVKDYVGKVGKVESIIVLDAPEDQPHSYKCLMKVASFSKPVPSVPNVDPDHLCTIIYTSGTTGKPKGVELSHINITSDIHGLKNMQAPDSLFQEHTSLAFLPWAHIFGMTTELHSLISTGSALAIVPHRDAILECLGIVKPTVIFSVPTLFNKVYDGVWKNLSTQSPLKQKIVKYALKTARERNSLMEQYLPVGPLLESKYKLVDRLILSKIRAKLGGRIQFMASGGAAISVPVLQFFEDIGVPILEGYGLTETSPAITGSSLGWHRRRLGTVGVPLMDQTVRIIDAETLEEVPHGTDGEVTCSGPNVMRGYRKNPQANAESFYEHEGKRFFRTGDMGRMVDHRFLKITGRIKEQFKLENGKYVVPAPMEDVFARSPFIAQCFLSGHNKPHTVALLVPNMAEVTAWVNQHKEGQTKDLVSLLPTPEQMADASLNTIPLFSHPVFAEKIDEELMRLGSAMKSYERPRRWAAILKPFTMDNQMLTPKMSLRRANISSAYQALIDDIYWGKVGHELESKRKLTSESIDVYV